MNDLKDYIHSKSEISNITLVGDFNQNICESDIQIFMVENRLHDIHEHVNQVEQHKRKNKHERGNSFMYT